MSGSSAFDLLRSAQRRLRGSVGLGAPSGAVEPRGDLPAAVAAPSQPANLSSPFAPVGFPSAHVLEEELIGADDVNVAMKAAHDMYAQGQEERAKCVVAQACSQHSSLDVLKAVARRTEELLDNADVTGSRWAGVPEDVVTRHLLYDKVRDLHEWLSFLADTALWSRIEGAEGAAAAKQFAVEACERAAGAARLRELHDREPEIFSAAVQRAMLLPCATRGPDPKKGSEVHQFYGQVSGIERLLEGLKEYPRSLPLGSGGVVDAALLMNETAVAFIDAALERRALIAAQFPTLLPCPDPAQTRRRLQSAASPPQVAGSEWLMATDIVHALEELRLVNLEVIPAATVKGHVLLDAQSLRVVESMKELCRATLRAAQACFVDLHSVPLARIRHSVLEHLAQAEMTLAQPLPGVRNIPQRALVLAEEFEDFDAVVNLTVESRNLVRLDQHMATSPAFRLHALQQFLRTPKLQPLFYRSIRLLPVPPAQLEELLAPHPELRWTLDVQKLADDSSEQDWRNALQSVKRQVSNNVQREKRSVAKQNVFVALDTLVAHASSSSSSQPCAQDSTVLDIGCLTRLHRVCDRFEASGMSVGEKRQREDGPPVPPEECLRRLSACMRSALSTLRSEKREGVLLKDAARLVRYVEHGMLERGVDTASALDKAFKGCSPEDEQAVRALQRLWSEAILADETLWQQVLSAPAGPEQQGVITKTGFYRMLLSLRDISFCPCSAKLDALCSSSDSFATRIQPLAPALRLAEAEMKGQRLIAVA
eukprot:TRINITY_DN25390_c0_g2_i1.p1 TRINITY_DN25390_c0_g2~~TRINITY_DN25390_c0_g2_i1.p1  ORF type:complete len:767 (+),score=173.04 TRINITY_DN25390_c0_g2_i1:98-2398(+)